MSEPGGPSSDYYQHSRRLGRGWLARVSLFVRRRSFDALLELMRPGAEDLVLDVGVTADVDMAESNVCERWYPYPHRLIGLGVDPLAALRPAFPAVRFVRGDARQLPFPSDAFDLVLSNATIEHVGDREAQAAFVREALRVARRCVIVTPNRWFPLELHTFLPLLHYLPRAWHRRLLARLGFSFYAREENLRLLAAGDLRHLFPVGAEVRVTYGLLGATLVAVAQRESR